MNTTTKRELGEETFEYADYRFRVKATWKDQDRKYKRTPRYVVSVDASRIDGSVGERFSVKKEKPLRPRRSLIDRLFRRQPRTRLSDVVRKAVDEVQQEIDEMYRDIGGDEHSEEFEAAMTAMTQVESWTEVSEEGGKQ